MPADPAPVSRYSNARECKDNNMDIMKIKKCNAHFFIPRQGLILFKGLSIYEKKEKSPDNSGENIGVTGRLPGG